MHVLHPLPQFVVFLFTLAVLTVLSSWIATRIPWRNRKRAVTILLTLDLLSTSFSALAFSLSFGRVNQHVSSWWAIWIQGAALMWSMCLTGLLLSLPLWGPIVRRPVRKFPTSRRSFLQAAGGGLLVAPVLVTGFGFIERNRIRLTEVDIVIPGLPQDLQGLRIVQISDVHLGPFLSQRELARAIDMANETRAHIALMTGDLITRRGDPLDACLRELARLRADAGVLGCLGNHETLTETEDYVTREGARVGIRFLRDQAAQLRFGGSTLNFAGVDYQPQRRVYLEGADRLVVPGAINVLLSHNPDVFPVAARQGYHLTIGGHTHGGQINFEILHQNWNIARYFTPYVRGLYREGRSSIYVSSGIGTVAMPVRLGAPAEVNLLRLCAS